MRDKYDNSGRLKPNRDKSKDSDPDYRGACTVDGTEYWFKAWRNEGETGEYLKVVFNRKDDDRRSRPDPQPSYSERKSSFSR